MTNVIGLVWLIFLAGALSIIQRKLHFETQAIFLLLTRRKEIALVLFSIMFLPGIILHECSHYLMARLLGVRTGRFSIIPRPKANGRLQLGFVETASTDIFRDALIGFSPLLIGSAFVIYAGMNPLGLSALWEAIRYEEISIIWKVIISLPSGSDFWLWFYLTLAVSSTMFPSASDRRAWLPVGIFFAVLFILFIFLNLALGFHDNFKSLIIYFTRGIQIVVLILAVSTIVHGLTFPLAWLFRNLLMKMKGKRLSIV